MLYFVNDPVRARRKGRKVKKRRTAAQKRATAKMIAARKRSLRHGKNPGTKRKSVARTTTSKTRSTTMAAKRKTGKKSTRRKSTKRRSPVTTLRRRAVYQTNPRRRRRSQARRHHRNPDIMRVGVQTLKDSAAVIGGAFIGAQANNVLPSFGSPYADAAKGVLVAIGVRMLGGRFLGPDVARFLAAGAMIAPVKQLIGAVSPQAAAMLGSYDQPVLSSYADVAGYLDAGEEQEVEVSSYSDAFGG